MFLKFLNNDQAKLLYIVIYSIYIHTHILLWWWVHIIASTHIYLYTLLYTHIIEISFLKRYLCILCTIYSFSYFIPYKIYNFWAPKLTLCHDSTYFLYTSHEVVELLWFFTSSHSTAQLPSDESLSVLQVHTLLILSFSPCFSNVSIFSGSFNSCKPLVPLKNNTSKMS